jgi:hypothetical protein
VLAGQGQDERERNADAARQVENDHGNGDTGGSEEAKHDSGLAKLAHFLTP